MYIDAYIPQDYIEDEDIRILFYRKISNICKEEDIIEISNELTDRFGKMPDNVKNLFTIAKIKILASKVYIERLSEDKKYLYTYIRKDINFNKFDSLQFVKDYNSLVEFNNANNFCFKLLKNKIHTNYIEYMVQFLNKFKKYIK